MDSQSQTSRILKALKKAPKSGVANYRFPAMNILCYSKRIQELRQEGYNISAERQIINGKLTGVWIYKLLPEDKVETKKRFSFLFN